MADQTDEAANAAARAAKDRAAKSHWPPTRDDTEAIGAAAGAAAGTVFGGPVGGAIGFAVGGFVGGVVYDLVNAIPDPSYSPDAAYIAAMRKRGKEVVGPTIRKLALNCNATEDEVIADLNHWGWKFDDSTFAWSQKAQRYGAPAAMQALEQNSKEFFQATAALSALCATYAEAHKHKYVTLKEPPKRGAGIGTVVVAAAGIGGAIWLASLL
jgi:hypothetical protein